MVRLKYLARRVIYMATLNWNVKLLGNLTPSDFTVWKDTAKIPGCYNFTVTNSADGWGEYPGEKEASIPIPDEGNTIIVTGKDAYDLFEPYCFADHKCVMNTEQTDFETGTRILSTIMSSDGLLDKNVIEAITNKIDMREWIKLNYPEATPCLDKISQCTDPATGYLNGTPDAIKLENAMCKYVLSALGICKSNLPSTEKQEPQRGIEPIYLVAGAGTIAAAGIGWYLWKNRNTI